MRSISTDYSRNPQQKVFFSPYFLVFDCFESASGIAKRSRRSAARKAASLNKLRQLKTTENARKKLQSVNAESWVRLSCQNRHYRSVHVVTGKLGQTSKGNMRRLELTIKDKNIRWKKNSPFVADFGCNRQIWISFNNSDDICDPK